MNNDSKDVPAPSELSIDEVMQVSGGIRHDPDCGERERICVDASGGYHCDPV